MPRRLLPLALAAVSLSVPATADAGVIMIGSDLSADAALSDSHPRDWAAWPGALASGGMVQAPSYGEVSMVQLKGTIRKPDNNARYDGSYPEFNLIVTVLRPQADGSIKMTVASEDLWARPDRPFGVPADTITTYDLQDFSSTTQSRLCVQPGDYVALNTSGGFGNTDPAFGGFPDDYYVDGYPVQMFGRVAGSSTSVFKQPASGHDDGNGFQVGDVERGTAQPGRELLMRVTLGTGREDSRASCWSPEDKALANELSTAAFPEQPFKLKLTRDRKVPVALSCVSKRSCAGELNLKTMSGKPVAVRTKFALQGQETATLPMQVNANGLRLLKLNRGKLRVQAFARVSGRKDGLYKRDFKLVR